MKIFKMIIITIFSLILWAGIIGWSMNVIKFCSLDFRPPIRAEAIRGIGLFSPIGCVTGYITIKDSSGDAGEK